ncbi:MAG TPA: ATP-binding protein [Bryobacteraceae bacterium]|nr:ATP-binding protein [Bryobacteraceae bacterium]
MGLLIMLTLATATIQRGTQRREDLIGALDESRDRLQTTLTSIGDGVITTDGDGRVTLLNPVAQALTGWTQQDAEGRPLEEIFIIRNADSGAEVENPVRKVLREGNVVGLANHTVLIAKNGQKIHIDDSAAPIRHANEVAGVVLVFRDITERKRSEEALQASNTALSLANDDLRQFAFAASHDLQEPLRMITAYSQLLVRGYGGEGSSAQREGEAAVCIDFITQGTKRMRELLADLLAYTQLTGETELTIGPVDLNEAAATAIENCSLAIAETAASVTSKALPVVAGYKPHFVQLFQNLISNGIKYRSERPPRVHVSVQREGGYWRIAVKDNGIGIAPQYQEQIFGVFKRLHGRSIPGTGIGLAICKRVVERYGGKIGVESEAGEGATFYFTVPVNSFGPQSNTDAHG